MNLSTQTAERSNTIAAIFATEHDAREGIKNLHKAGFKKTWLGTTREPDRTTGEPTVDADGSLSRLLSAGAERRPLHRALIERGVSESQARAIEDDIALGNIVVTAYGEDNPQRAAELLEEAKGAVVDATGAMPSAVERASLDPRTGVDKKDRDDHTGHVHRDETVEPLGDIDGYESEEFIATGRGYTG